MITLRHAVEIKSSPERIFGFFANMAENYRAWHPDHVEWHYLPSGQLGEGSTIYAEEYLHGKLHKLRGPITKVETNYRMEYKPMFGVRGVFATEPRGETSLFTAEIHIGTEIPLLGMLLDRLMRIFMSPQLAAIEQHMAEEGQSLKRILEEGIQ